MMLAWAEHRADSAARARALRVDRTIALVLAVQLVAFAIFGWSRSLAAAEPSPPPARPPLSPPPLAPRFGPFASFLRLQADARVAPDLVLFFTGSNRTARNYPWVLPRASAAHVWLVDSLWTIDECLLLASAASSLSPRSILLAGHSSGAMRALHTASRCPLPPSVPLSLLLLALPSQFMRQPASLPSSLPARVGVVMATGQYDCEREFRRLPPCGERIRTCLRLSVCGATHAGWAHVGDDDVPASDAATMPHCKARLEPSAQQRVGADLVEAMLTWTAREFVLDDVADLVWFRELDVVGELHGGNTDVAAEGGDETGCQCASFT